MALIEPGDIAELVFSGQFVEDPQLEAKRATGSIPKSLWESCSAFANTSGGVIVLGLDQTDEGWVVTGVANPEKMIQDLFNQVRDAQKISFPFASNEDIWTEVVDGRTLIVIRVRVAPRRLRPVFINNRRENAYVRRGEGDFPCSEPEIERMRLNAGTTRYDQTIYPQLGWDVFCKETIARYRSLYEQRKPDLPHHQLDDQEFLRLVGAWRKDWDTGDEGPTLAGILMFGRDEVIQHIRPNHVIDYRRLPIGGLSAEDEHFADRERWRGNLFGAWEAIFPRLVRHLNLPDRRTSAYRTSQRAGESTLREAFVNMLVHSDYQEASDAVIIQRDDGYLFRNPGDSWVDVRELGVQGRSERRNPGIAQLFDNIGLAEQAGSGYAAILEEWRRLGYTPPVIGSDSLRFEFTLDLALTHLIDPEDRQWLQSLGGSWKPEEEIALVFARHDGRVDNVTLRNATGIDVLAASQLLRSLRDRQFLVLQGSGKNAFYVPGAEMLKDGRNVRTNTDHLPPGTDHLDSDTDHLPPGTDHLDSDTDHLPPGTDHTWIESEIQRIASPVASTGKATAEDMKVAIVGLCAITPMSTDDLVKILNRTLVTIRRYVRDLVETGELAPIHAQIRHPQQRYRAVLRPLGTATQTRMPI